MKPNRSHPELANALVASAITLGVGLCTLLAASEAARLFAQ